VDESRFRSSARRVRPRCRAHLLQLLQQHTCRLSGLTHPSQTSLGLERGSRNPMQCSSSPRALPVQMRGVRTHSTRLATPTTRRARATPRFLRASSGPQATGTEDLQRCVRLRTYTSERQRLSRHGRQVQLAKRADGHAACIATRGRRIASDGCWGCGCAGSSQQPRRQTRRCGQSSRPPSVGCNCLVALTLQQRQYSTSAPWHRSLMPLRGPRCRPHRTDPLPCLGLCGGLLHRAIAEGVCMLAKPDAGHLAGHPLTPER
jgi:hypothetical protein